MAPANFQLIETSSESGVDFQPVGFVVRYLKMVKVPPAPDDLAIDHVASWAASTLGGADGSGLEQPENKEERKDIRDMVTSRVFTLNGGKLEPND